MTTASNICQILQIVIMADHRRIQPTSLDEQFDFTAQDLSKQFEQLLLTRRLNELEEQTRAHRPSTPQNSAQREQSQPQRQQNRPTTTQHHAYRSTPLVPCAPQDPTSLKFRNLLLTLSVTPTKYENPGLLDEALTHVPIDRIYSAAEEEHNIMKGMAASMGDGKKEEWGYQDCVIRALLRSVCSPNAMIRTNSLTDGSNENSSNLYVTQHAQFVVERRFHRVTYHQHKKNMRMVLPESNFIDVRHLIVAHTNDSQDIQTFGY